VTREKGKGKVINEKGTRDKGKVTRERGKVSINLKLKTKN